MDKINLIKELNQSTIKKDEFELALERSGLDLPPAEDEMDDIDALDDEGMGGEDEMDDLDSDGDSEYTSETSLEDDEIQEIVDWCEEECSDLSDDELIDTLRDELDELDLESDDLDSTVDRVMSMLGRGSDEDEMDGEMDADAEMDDELGGEEGMGDEELPDDEEEEFSGIDTSDFEIDPDTDFRQAEDPAAEFEIDPADFRSPEEERLLPAKPPRSFKDFMGRTKR